MGLARQGQRLLDTAVRALLGVSDQRRKVTSSMRGGDCGSTYTPESWEQVSVSCAEWNADFQDLPELMRAGLDFLTADGEDRGRPSFVALRLVPMISALLPQIRWLLVGQEGR